MDGFDGFYGFYNFYGIGSGTLKWPAISIENMVG